MTVSRHRRRVSTTRAAIASLVAAGVALGLGLAGAIAIYHTTDGQVRGSDTPELTFPPTPTGMLAVVDGRGELTSLAVFAVRPPAGDDDGRGGSIVPVPITADASGGFGDERLPLNETVALFGVDALADEVTALLGISIDQLAVVDRTQLTTTLAPLATLDVDLPSAVTVGGAEIAQQGHQTLAADVAATILATPLPGLDGSERYPIDVAVWRGVAAAVADGTALSLPDAAESTVASAGTEPSIGELVARLTSETISIQPLRSRPIVSVDANPRGVDAVALDRAEVAVIFGHIAPGKVSAPNAGYNFRVISDYSDAQLRRQASRLDVAYTATKALFELGANVLSVDTVGAEAAAETIVEVSDSALVAVAERLADVFGPVDVRVAEERIAGVDVIVRLGTAYLERLDASAAPATSTPAESSPAPTSIVGEGTS